MKKIVLAIIFCVFLVGCTPSENQTSPKLYYTSSPPSSSVCGDGACDSDESFASCRQDCKLEEIQRIAEEYSRTHTYSKLDLFVCSDMAQDVWNLIETQGINAQICAGNVDEDIREVLKQEHNWDTTFEFLNKITHAWVVAETEPNTYIAVETTGGFLVWSNSNQLYYSGLCFDSPKQFKDFLEARKNTIEICSVALNMENYWNENYVGRVLTAEVYEFKGVMEQKAKECTTAVNELITSGN
jgi:hypothetical protein